MSEVKTDKISSVSTNGDITLDPDGTGIVSTASHVRVTGGDDCDIEFQSGSARRKFIGGDVNDLELGTYSSSNTSRDVHMVINSSGNVGIGATDPNHGSHSKALLVSDTSSGARSAVEIEGNSSNANGTLIFLNNGSKSCSIDSRGTGTMTLNGASSEYARFDSSGNLAVGQTSVGLSTVGCNIRPIGLVQAIRDDAAAVEIRRNNSNGSIQTFRRDGTTVGGINVTTSSTSYATSSDHRLKENVADMTGAIARVKQLAPKRFNFIADADTTVDGFLAHEAQTVVPEAVHGTHNEVDDDGNAVMQGIDQSKLVPLLTGALQEAIAKIEALEARVTALEDA